ncbi:MAG: helix-turn-helix transcriptional regulator [Myxococcota bacterium]
MSAARTERLLNLLTLLLNARRPVSLREIRELEEFEAYKSSDPKSGERAFERDKSALLELGVPLRWVAPEREDEEDGSGGYLVDRDKYYLPDLALQPTELALLSIAGAAAASVAGFPGRAAVIRALAKLGFDVDEARMPSTMAHSPVQEGVDAERVGAHLAKLHEAVAVQRRMRVVYDGGRGAAPTTREVDPYGLYYKQGAWYLVGFCHLRKAERTFHLARIRELGDVRAGSQHEFTVPKDFDLAQHARRRPWEFPQEKPYAVTVKLADRLLPAMHEIFGPNVTSEPAPGGGAVVRLRATHTNALVNTLLPYGAAAEVLEPQSLRDTMRSTYERLAAAYT